MSGKKFSKDPTDWTWWDAGVPGRLKELHKNGYLVTIFSNQGGIRLREESKTANQDKRRLADFKAKLGAVMDQLDMPMSVYAATLKDHYRKPRTGMWQEMIEYNGLSADRGVDLANSIYVGDAAGRTAQESKTDKDFASSDRDFAANLGIKFQTPEEFFLGQTPQVFARAFDPLLYMSKSTTARYTKSNDKDIVVLVGSPGAGKSTYYWTNLQPLGYERVNQDILKSRQNCIKAANDFLKEGKSVAIDNTNADPETRAHWLELGKTYRVPVRCVVLSADMNLAQHNDAVRALNELMNPEKRTRLPGVAFGSFASRYRPPALSEGFQDITLVDFQFEGDDKQRAAWSQYYL